MEAGTIISLLALVLVIVGNIIAITRFSTKQEVTLASVQAAFREFKENIHTSIKDLKEDVNQKIVNNQQETSKHFERLEKKQDKHNNLIERMAIVEQSTKSAHKRLDEITGVNK